MHKPKLSTSTTKTIFSNLVKNLHVKKMDDYEEAEGYKKTRGRSRGTWMRRKKKDVSKRSAWLFKSGGGQGILPKLPAGEIHAIREAYAGAIYQIFIPEHTPKTRLVLNIKADETKSWKYSTASKEIKELMFLAPEKINENKFIDKYKIQVTKVFILSVILGEIDFSFSNCALSEDKRFIKIDHGETFALQPDGNAFVKPFRPDQIYNSKYWVQASMNYLNANFFTQNVIEQAIAELMAVNLEKVNTIATQYEDLLSEYRNIYKEKSFYLLGNEVNKIQTIFMQRLKQLHEAYSNKQECFDVSLKTPKR